MLTVHLWATPSLGSQAAHIQVCARLPSCHHAQMFTLAAASPWPTPRDKLLIRHSQLSPVLFSGAAALSHYGFTLGLISNKQGT